jgi:hypothetical protein
MRLEAPLSSGRRRGGDVDPPAAPRQPEAAPTSPSLPWGGAMIGAVVRAVPTVDGAALSHLEKAVEELAITLESDAKVLGGSFLAATSLPFQVRTCVGEAGDELPHDVGDQPVGFLHARLRVVDEDRLHLAPSGPQRGQ